MMRISFIPLLLTAVLCFSCTQAQEQSQSKTATIEITASENEAVATFASGCFWCVEEVFESLVGVREAVSGYAGGSEKDPSYKQVSSGTTGHAEAVQVYYDPGKISFEVLVDAFFASHDPTTPNRQGPDAGPQYRSVAFYETDEEKQIIEAAIKELKAEGKYSSPIVTEVTKLDKFYPAEDYHQDYVEHHPNQPYVRGVSIPRFEKFKASFDQKYFK